MKLWPFVASMILAIAGAHAQTPYAGMQTRAIKALSEQQAATSGPAAAWAWRWPPS